MFINEKETLILQYNNNKREWEDVTCKIQWFKAENSACRIKYTTSETFYWKSYKDLIIKEARKKISVIDKIVFFNNNPIYGLSTINSLG